MFKSIAWEYKSAGGGGRGNHGGSGDVPSGEKQEMMKTIADLQGCLLQRDNEIAILVNMVKKGKTANDVMSAANSAAGGPRSEHNSNSNNNNNNKKQVHEYNRKLDSEGNGWGHDSTDRSSASQKGIVGGKNGSTDSRSMGYSPAPSPMHTSAPEPTGPPVVAPMGKEEKMIQRHLFGIAPPDNRRVLEEPGGKVNGISVVVQCNVILL